MKDIPANAATFKVKIPPQARLGGHHIFPIAFYSKKGQEVAEKNLFAHIDIMGEIYRTTQKVRKGTVLQQKHIIKKKESILKAQHNRLKSWDDIIGKEAKMTLSEGTIITDYLVQEMPIIRRGDTIDIIINKSGITLTVKGTALSNGYIDDTIQARTLVKKSKIIEGKVLKNASIKMHSL